MNFFKQAEFQLKLFLHYQKPLFHLFKNND